ncbi:hypothetical protein ACWC6I_30230 [Streptomyces sp. NPDC001414]
MNTSTSPTAAWLTSMATWPGQGTGSGNSTTDRTSAPAREASSRHA